MGHSQPFALTVSCPACELDPPPAPAMDVVAAEIEPPKGCLSTVALERRMVGRLETIDALLARLHDQLAKTPKGKPRTAKLNKFDLKVVNSLAKLEEVLLKRERLVLDIARAREEAEVVRQMRAERARLHGATN